MWIELVLSQSTLKGTRFYIQLHAGNNLVHLGNFVHMYIVVMLCVQLY